MISLILSHTAVLVYDYFLTFSMEVELVWCNKFSLTALLFYFNRYASIIEALIDCIFTPISGGSAPVSVLYYPVDLFC